jgi:5-methylcytosine-specific restriction endonuclease McrA
MKRLAIVIWWVALVILVGWQLALAAFITWRLVRWSLRRSSRRTFTTPPEPTDIPLPEGYDRIREHIDKRTKAMVMARDGWRCRNPRCRTKTGPFHCDHIWPVARGGTNRLVNLQTLCATCNRTKSANVPHWSLVPKGEPIHYTQAELDAFHAMGLA